MAALPNALSRGASCYSFSCPSAIPSVCGAYSSGNMAESHLIYPPSLHAGQGYLFAGGVPPNDTLNSKSVVGVKPGDSDVELVSS